MSAAMRKLTSLISRARTLCIFTNQIREKIGVMFGNPETTPGGRALKFFSSVRVDVRRIGQIKGSEGNVTGSRTKVKIVKNKVAPPFGEAEFDIMYDEGISSTGSLLDLALEQEILQKRGSWISYKGSQLAQGLVCGAGSGGEGKAGHQVWRGGGCRASGGTDPGRGVSAGPVCRV
jgi:recombination protein RecA